MTRYFYLVLILITLSCADEKSSRWTTVRINAKNAISGNAVPGISFYIQDDREYGSNAYFLAASGITDNSGYLELSFKSKIRRGYKLRPYLAGHNIYYGYENIDHEVIGIEDPIMVGEENNLDLLILKKGFLNISIENVGCDDEDDVFWYELSYEGNYSSVAAWNGMAWNNYYGYNGCGPHSKEQFKIFAGAYKVDWNISRDNGMDSSGVVEFFVQENDTLDLLIQY